MTEEKQRLYQAYKNFADSEAGKLILEDLSTLCYEHHNTFTCNFAGDGINNAAMQNFRNGKRSVMLYIREKIKFDLDKPETKPEEDKNYI